MSHCNQLGLRCVFKGLAGKFASVTSEDYHLTTVDDSCNEILKLKCHKTSGPGKERSTPLYMEYSTFTFTDTLSIGLRRNARGSCNGVRSNALVVSASYQTRVVAPRHYNLLM